VNAAAVLYLSENAVEEDPEEGVIAGKIPDGLNANEFARLLHCVFDNQTAGALKKITEGLEREDLDARNSMAE
jgi:hypothetical protein